MTTKELEQITKWLETNANASKFHNVYEMIECFKFEFNHLLQDELTFNKGVWATIQCLAIDHQLPTVALFVANDMKISKSEAQAMQEESGYNDEEMLEVIDYLTD